MQNTISPAAILRSLYTSANRLRNKLDNGDWAFREVYHFVDEVERFTPLIEDSIHEKDIQLERNSNIETDMMTMYQSLALGDVAYQSEKLLSKLAFNNPRASLPDSLDYLTTSQFFKNYLFERGCDLDDIKISIETFKEERFVYAHPCLCGAITPDDQTLRNFAESENLRLEINTLLNLKNQILESGDFFRERTWRLR